MFFQLLIETSLNDSPPLPSANKRSDRVLFTAAILLSLLIHSAFYLNTVIGIAEQPEAAMQATIVELYPEIKGSKQIISPPDKSDAIPPQPTERLNDTDTQAKIETIRRGEGHQAQNGAVKAVQPAAVPQPDKTAPAPQKSVPKHPETVPKKTTPDEQTAPKRQLAKNIPAGPLFLGEKFRTQEAETKEPAPKSPAPEENSASVEGRIPADYEPFRSIPLVTGSSGKNGAADLLPSVPDGEMTMLNAKAERFAVFVRRVASQVFGLLRVSNWSQLSSGEIRQIGDYAKIHAVMSADGKFIKLWLENSSGSLRFDKVVTGSVERGLDDQNPPPSARSEDGNYHFIFISKTWSRPAGERMREQRWLLLGTGLL